MRIFLLLIALSLSAAGYSQTTFTVTIPQDVATQDWVKNYVKVKLDSLNSVKPPVIALPKCDQGPEIKSITNISPEYLTVNFHGQNVTHLQWELHQGISAETGDGVFLYDIPSHIGLAKPTSNSIKISFGTTMPAGPYTLKLIALNCTGSDSRKFTIK